MSKNESGPQPVDYKTGILNRFHELTENHEQIAFLVDMEGVILPHSFPRIVDSSSHDTWGIEDKIIKRGIRTLKTNKALLDLLAGFLKKYGDDKILVASAIHLRIKNRSEDSKFGQIVDMGIGKSHEELYQVAKKSFHGENDGYTLKEESLAINLVYKTDKHSQTVLDFLKNRQVNFSSLYFLKIKLPIFHDNNVDYQNQFQEDFYNGLLREPIKPPTILSR